MMGLLVSDLILGKEYEGGGWDVVGRMIIPRYHVILILSSLRQQNV